MTFRFTEHQIGRRLVGRSLSLKIKSKNISPPTQSLREVVPEEVLPPLWGGSNTNTCPEIEASDFATIGLGGPVPLYYQTVQKHKDIPGGSFIQLSSGSNNYVHEGMEDTNTLVIPRRSTFTLRYTIKQSCTLRWRFKSEGKWLVDGGSRNQQTN